MADKTSLTQRKVSVTAAQQNGRSPVETTFINIGDKPMNTQVPEQIVASQKVGVEALYGLFSTALGGYEKLAALNLQAAKASILENEAVTSEALARSAKNPQSFFELQSRQSQATTTKAQAYWHHVNEIATETRSQLLASSEKLVSEYVRETQIIINSLANNTPAASDATAFWSKGFGAMWDAGKALHEQTKAAAKDDVDVIDKAGKPVAKV
jgi:phasin family protein